MDLRDSLVTGIKTTLSVPRGCLISQDEWINSVEVPEVRIAEAQEFGAITSDNFSDMIRHKLFSRIADRDGIPYAACMFPKDIIERLDAWTPWAELKNYLESNNVGLILVFVNTSVLIGVMYYYAAEIRAVPIGEDTM